MINKRLKNAANYQKSQLNLNLFIKKGYNNNKFQLIKFN